MRPRGFVTRSPSSGGYALGLKLVELGQVVIGRIGLRSIALPHLQELVKITGETANLVILDGRNVVYVDKVESPSVLLTLHRIGKRAPAHTTGAGKVLLGFLQDEDLSRLIKGEPLVSLTSHTIVSPEQLWEELELVRELGFGVDREECEVGAKCVAAPLYDHTGTVVAAVSISGPSARLPEERLIELSQIVRAAATKISQELGFRGD